MKWLSAEGKIDERKFCEEFSAAFPIKYIGGRFYSVDGEESGKSIEAKIGKMLFQSGIKSGIATKTVNLYEALKLYCYSEPLPISTVEIHVQNGVLNTNGNFSSKKDFCRNRLNVEYDPSLGNPKHFLAYLSDLLEDEDIRTLQEYLGYCLIPSTKGQAALFIIGPGGEGKSCIGVVLNSIFGKAMHPGKLHAVEINRFFRYNLINKLLMFDDDLQIDALKSTGYIKSIITAEIPMDVEAKFQQSHQELLYSRFLCFGNESPKALYDKSEGFARRLLILKTKPKQPDRVDDPYINDRLIDEINEIFLWLFKGLKRLIENNFHFTVSERARQNLADAMTENCNIIQFLADENYVILGEGETASADLYYYYSLWARRNALEPLKKHTFIAWLHDNQRRYGIQNDNHIKNNFGQEVRGFRGIKIKPI